MSMNGLVWRMQKGKAKIYHQMLLIRYALRQKEAEELRERMEREKRELQEFIGIEELEF